jgi:hypothetical protein
MYRQISPGKFTVQTFDDVPVNFHNVEVVERMHQRPGQRTQPGPYLYEVIALARMDSADNVRYSLGIDKKILTETFAGDMAHDLLELTRPVALAVLGVSLGRPGTTASNHPALERAQGNPNYKRSL